jgi:hypothetical protein
MKDNLEKSTLGDLSVLSNLKNEMEQNEKKAATKKKAADDSEEA